MSVAPGTLHLIPVGLGEADPAAWLPPEVQSLAASLDCYIAENAKTARAFLKQIGTRHALQDVEIHTLGEQVDDVMPQHAGQGGAGQERQAVGVTHEVGVEDAVVAPAGDGQGRGRLKRDARETDEGVDGDHAASPLLCVRFHGASALASAARRMTPRAPTPSS